MKKLIRSFFVALALNISALGVATAGDDSSNSETAQACQSRARTKIEAVLADYQKALNASDTDAVMVLYADDGVFMPSNKPTASGRQQLREAYDDVFKHLELKVSFHIEEIQIRHDIAFARTVSDGDIKLLQEDVNIVNNSRELFVMKRIGGGWKIYRYMFNETQ